MHQGLQQGSFFPSSQISISALQHNEVDTSFYLISTITVSIIPFHFKISLISALCKQYIDQNYTWLEKYCYSWVMDGKKAVSSLHHRWMVFLKPMLLQTTCISYHLGFFLAKLMAFSKYSTALSSCSCNINTEQIKSLQIILHSFQDTHVKMRRLILV